MLVTTTYLEMHSHQPRVVPPPRDGLTVMQARHPTVAYYRFLYNAVGEQWHWGRCKRLSEAELTALIQHPQMEVHVLYVDGVPAGFAELDRRTPGDVEILQFGLTADFIGQGLGKYFLQWVIDRAWSYAPKRVWLHTCTLDHPGAIPNYRKAGFAVYKEETAERIL
jgi:GNAT superfamily N-acetyltransferase